MSAKTLTRTQLRKAKKGVCVVNFCRKETPAGAKKCSRCARRIWAKNNPLKYRFANLRGNARKRRIPFLLTFDHFVEVAAAAGYDKKSGTSKRALQVDRKDARLPYQDGNIQILTAYKNGQKGYSERGAGYHSSGGACNEDEAPF